MVGYTERDIDDLTNIYINQVVYPEDLLDEDQNDGNENPMSKTNILEMPKSIYVTTVRKKFVLTRASKYFQLPTDVFKVDELKTEFENLFQNAKFYYFPNFNRCRVEFEDSVEACRARIRFHLFNFHGNRLRVFLTNHSCCDNPETETEFLKERIQKSNVIPTFGVQFLICKKATKTRKTIFNITTCITARGMAANKRRRAKFRATRTSFRIGCSSCCS